MGEKAGGAEAVEPIITTESRRHGIHERDGYDEVSYASSPSSPRKRGSRYLLPVKQFYVYILCSKRNGTLYTGMTSDLIKRVYEHKNGLAEGFTKAYGVHFLVWYELHQTAETAITREKQIKKWNRLWKLELVEKDNPEWKDLYCGLVNEPGFPLSRE